jgi:hypothetical protein
MLLTITISIFALLIFNLLLLKFSCNKTLHKKKQIKMPVKLEPKITIEQDSEKLAPTGS